MAKRNKAVQQALDGAVALSEAQTLVRRLIEDEELREAVGRAIDSSRRVYDRVSSAKKPTKLIEDKKLQSDAIEAFDAIRTVTGSLAAAGKSGPGPKRRKKRRAIRSARSSELARS